MTGLSAEGQVVNRPLKTRHEVFSFCFESQQLPRARQGRSKGRFLGREQGGDRGQLEPDASPVGTLFRWGRISSPSSSHLRSQLSADASVLGCFVGTPNSGGPTCLVECSKSCTLGTPQPRQTRVAQTAGHPTNSSSWSPFPPGSPAGPRGTIVLPDDLGVTLGPPCCPPGRPLLTWLLKSPACLSAFLHLSHLYCLNLVPSSRIQAMGAGRVIKH